MGWLGHYEFGLDHRPFDFAVPAMDATLSPDDPNYWLDYWNAVYRHVLEHQHLKIHLVDHDLLCAAPIKALVAIFQALGIDADTALLAKQIAATKGTASADGLRPETLRCARETHNALLASAKNLLRT